MRAVHQAGGWASIGVGNQRARSRTNTPATHDHPPQAGSQLMVAATKEGVAVAAELTWQRLRPTVPRPGWSGPRRNSMVPAQSSRYDRLSCACTKANSS